MKKIILSLCVASALAVSANAAAKEFSASLDGHIIIDADTKITPPKDAPEFVKSVGKFFTKTRTDKLESVPVTKPRASGFSLPFKDQHIQGHSGIKYIGNDEYWVLTDNGLGAKANSADAMLYINKYKLDFKNGTAKHLQTIFFNDENKKMPYKITLEGTQKRYLTGADLDLESFQIIGDKFFLAEEFGPFLMEFDNKGTLIKLYDVEIDGTKLVSPDNPYLVRRAKPDTNAEEFNVKRSKGFEGMASSKDGKKLYLLLEGPIYKKGAYENEKGKQFLRIFEFDIAKRAFTGKSFKYALEDNKNAIGDFNMIDENYGLIIERDDTEGTADKACKGKDKSKCFSDAAKFKRIYKVKLDSKSGVAEKVAYIDLMNINDERKIAKKPLVDAKFVFPFMTIENVDVVDSSHIIVGNDNNFPFSTSREPNKADDNEFILLNVKDFLEAK